MPHATKKSLLERFKNMTRENLSRQENKSRVWKRFSCFITKEIINRVSRANSPEIFASVETPLYTTRSRLVFQTLLKHV